VAGTRVEGRASLAFPLGIRESAQLYAAAYRLSGGSVPFVALPPAGSLPLEGATEFPARLLLQVGGERRLTRGPVDLVPHGGIRLLRNSAGVGQGWLASIGGHAELRELAVISGGGLALEPGVDLRLGRLTASKDVASSIVGWGASVTLRWVR